MQLTKPEAETFYAKNRQEWRQWLKDNHALKQSVWLVQYKKQSNIPSISWSEAVEEALCFGWIDSTRKSVDHQQFIQFFTKRKANSMWSKINKIKIEQLIKDGLMEEAGYESIRIAKANGYWNVLDGVEELEAPSGLEKEFEKHPGSRDFFLGLSKSAKKMILTWIALAKRPETRENRIKEVAELAAQRLKPKQFR